MSQKIKLQILVHIITNYW